MSVISNGSAKTDHWLLRRWSWWQTLLYLTSAMSLGYAMGRVYERCVAQPFLLSGVAAGRTGQVLLAAVLLMVGCGAATVLLVVSTRRVYAQWMESGKPLGEIWRFAVRGLATFTAGVLCISIGVTIVDILLIVNSSPERGKWLLEYLLSR